MKYDQTKVNVQYLDTLVGPSKFRIVEPKDHIHKPSETVITTFINAILHSWSEYFIDPDITHIRTLLLQKNKIVLVQQDPPNIDFTLNGKNMRDEMVMELVSYMEGETTGYFWEVN
jgi:hypothetical protein